MRTLVVGCNHRSAPVEMRERIAFDEAAAARALAQFREAFPAAECVLVSTCNRLELYVARPVHGQPRIAEVMEFIGRCHGVPASTFASGLYSFEDVEAVRHLFRVAGSLDSMVIGETQILGQVKTAFEQAQAAGTVGRTLNDLFQRAFRVAKCVHSTGITAGRLSVGSTAVDLARQIFSRFDDKTAMIVGAGKMGELTLVHLLETKPGRLWVTNRTDARAAELADKIRRRHGVPAEVVPYAQWIDRLADVDILISSTGSHEPILTAAQFKPIPRRRGYRAILLIDIAVPRDIEAAVGEDDSVFLYNIDDLQQVTEANLAQRRQAIGRAQEIVEAEVLQYVRTQDRQDLGPLVATLRRHFQTVGDQEFARILPKLTAPSQRDRELIQQMLHRVTQKLLHNPIHLLNNHADNGTTRIYADMLRTLFDLHEEEAKAAPPAEQGPTDGS
ncbi:MAG: glutamyl-tRNA reductase [Planctomycetes bacterium]|nr:glutamyl-tRNA reductase [Planctomycetota bacterium]